MDHQYLREHSVAGPRQSSSSVCDDLTAMLNVFAAPAETVKRADRKFFWVWPFLIASAAGIFTELHLAPVAMRIMQTNPPLGFSTDQIQPVIDILGTVLKAGALLSPVLLAAKLFGLACVLVWTCKAMHIPIAFLAAFNLLAACSLVEALGTVANYLIIHYRVADLHSLDQLQAPLGLDFFLSHGAGKELAATLNFFSIFEVWYLIILAVGVSYLTGCTKRKAVAAITLVWLPSLAFAMLSASF